MGSTIDPLDMPGGGSPEAGGAEPTEEERAAAATALRMIQGIHVSRAIYVAAELGIADRLGSGPMSSAELAQATETHEPSLYRVLRLLAALGVFREEKPRSFSLTVLGDRLRTGAPASVRSMATLLDTSGGVGAFEYIADTIRTGKPSFDFADRLEFLAQHPAKAAAFDATMSERTAALAPSVAEGYDFSQLRAVVDVGGGQGILLGAILGRHSHLRGVLFERPRVVAAAHAVLQDAGVADRCEVIAGDFFERVPQGADGYILANVLHDWDDARAVEILSNCRRAMAENGRVLIVERLIPDDLGEAVPTLLSDLNMLVLTGGQERTNAEYGELLTAASLGLGKIQPVAFPYGVIEGLAS